MVKIESPNLFKPSEEMRDLRLLDEIDKNPVISQRELSHRFGIALGVTNACLRRMVHKGWIRLRGANHRKIGYYLTPRGFSERARLTVYLISCTVRHYSELKRIISERFLEMQRDGVERMVFYGVSDEMEVAYITLQGVNMKLVGIVEDDEKFSPLIVFNYEIEPVSRIRDLKAQGVLITSTQDIGQRTERLTQLLNGSSICIKDICFP